LSYNQFHIFQKLKNIRRENIKDEEINEVHIPNKQNTEAYYSKEKGKLVTVAYGINTQTNFPRGTHPSLLF